MKKINNIIVIAIIAIFAVACTDEEQFADSKKNNTNNKTIDKSDFLPVSPFPEYEQIVITDQEAMELLDNFNKAMNDEIPMPDMDIKEALLAMEMYFNYAIVDKNVNYDTNESYSQQEFEFTINQNDKISGTELKTNYRNFLIDIKNIMANKFLKFSDMFVSSKTSSTITFKIIIPPYLEDTPYHNAAMIHMPSCPVVREVGDIPTVPEDVHIDIADYVNNGQIINPNSDFSYPLDQLRSLCLKPLYGFVYGITSFNPTSEYTGVYHWLVALNYPNYFVSPYPYFNNIDFEQTIIPATLNFADQIRQSFTEGSLLLDIFTNIEFRGYIGLKSNYVSAAMLSIDMWMKGTVIPVISLSLDLNDIVFVP